MLVGNQHSTAGAKSVGDGRFRAETQVAKHRDAPDPGQLLPRVFDTTDVHFFTRALPSRLVHTFTEDKAPVLCEPPRGTYEVFEMVNHPGAIMSWEFPGMQSRVFSGDSHGCSP